MNKDKPAPRSYQRRVAIAATSGPFLPANNRRRGFLVSGLNATRVTITDEATAVIDQGITVPLGFPPQHFCLYLHGDWVQHQLQCIGAGAETISVIEVLE